VSVGVLPGGPVAITPERASVELDHGRARVVVAVVDPRGSLAGWTAALAADMPDGAHLSVTVRSDNEEATPRGGHVEGTDTIAVARSGGGGGTTTLTLDLRVTGKRNLLPHDLDLRFTVG